MTETEFSELRDAALKVVLERHQDNGRTAVNPFTARELGATSKYMKFLCKEYFKASIIKKRKAFVGSLGQFFGTEAEGRKVLDRLPEKFFSDVEIVKISVPLAWAVPGVSFSVGAGHHRSIDYTGKWWAAYTPCLLDVFLSKFPQAVHFHICLIVHAPPTPRTTPIALFCPPERAETLLVEVRRCDCNHRRNLPPDARALLCACPPDRPSFAAPDEVKHEYGAARESFQDGIAIPQLCDKWKWWPERLAKRRGAFYDVWMHFMGYASVFEKRWPNLRHMRFKGVWTSTYAKAETTTFPALEVVRASAIYMDLDFETYQSVMFPAKSIRAEFVVSDELLEGSGDNLHECLVKDTVDGGGTVKIAMTWPPIKPRIGEIAFPDTFRLELMLRPRDTTTNASVNDPWQLDLLRDMAERVTLDLRALTHEQRWRLKVEYDEFTFV